jgi:hypothetical protein
VKAKEEGQGWRRACEVEDMRDSCALALTSNWRGAARWCSEAVGVPSRPPTVGNVGGGKVRSEEEGQGWRRARAR